MAKRFNTAPQIYDSIIVLRFCGDFEQHISRESRLIKDYRFHEYPYPPSKYVILAQKN